jgi:hypothetical protein
MLELSDPDKAFRIEIESSGLGKWLSRFIWVGGTTGSVSTDDDWKRLVSLALVASMPSAGLNDVYHSLIDDFVFYTVPQGKAIPPPLTFQTGRIGPTIQRPGPRFELE